MIGKKLRASYCYSIKVYVLNWQKKKLRDLLTTLPNLYE